ncbi:MAG: polysaccharide pyruvyl transferase family protein [Pyramidobacter sp.]|nr:polysaccharide pyruvyl transferase family protein [Pyramidobacter sp.]
MKIGKITLDGYANYGNVLQNYALNKVLERYGETETIWLDPQVGLSAMRMPRPWRWSLPKFIRNPRAHFDEFRVTMMEAARRAFIKSFCDRFISIRYDARLNEIADEYDFFVVGSDQVWNPNWGSFDTLYDAHFLTFARSEQRISYAASIASPTVPEKRRAAFTSGLRGMKALSVREDDGARLVRELTGRDAAVHPDPTLLLDADEWRQIARRPTWLKDEPYLLTYFLSDRPDAAAKVAQENGLKLINLFDANVFDHYAVAPEEWLYLFDHASLVYTDSFHGTAFSIQFCTPFVVCDRAGEKKKKTMSSRIDTLLGTAGLNGCRGTLENGFRVEGVLSGTMPDPDEVFAAGRVAAAEYLERALGKR